MQEFFYKKTWLLIVWLKSTKNGKTVIRNPNIIMKMHIMESSSNGKYFVSILFLVASAAGSESMAKQKT